MSNTEGMTPIICHGCGQKGLVRTASIAEDTICKTCGTGDNLDIYDGEFHTAAGPNESAGGNGSTGWGKPMPNRLENWDEYEGPKVDPNPLETSHLVGDPDAYNDGDWSRGNPGYIPGGGYDNAPRHLGPTTGVPSAEQYDSHAGPQSGGARWQGKGASLQPIAMVPLRVTLPDGTKWEGQGHVVSTPKKAVRKVSKLEKMTKLIKNANPGLTDDEAKNLASMSESKWGSN